MTTTSVSSRKMAIPITSILPLQSLPNVGVFFRAVCSIYRWMCRLCDFSITVHASLFARCQQVRMLPNLLCTATTYSLDGSNRSARGLEYMPNTLIMHILCLHIFVAEKSH